MTSAVEIGGWVGREWRWVGRGWMGAARLPQVVCLWLFVFGSFYILILTNLNGHVSGLDDAAARQAAVANFASEWAWYLPKMMGYVFIGTFLSIWTLSRSWAMLVDGLQRWNV